MASALEQFVNNVRTFSAQGNFRELCDLLSKSTEVLMKNGQHLDNVLETLDLQQHSLGVLAVLCVKFNLPAPAATPDHHELLFAQVQEFITGCNGEQVRFAPDTYAELCHQLTHSLADLKVPLRGIDLIRRAIRKIQLFDSQLTSVHADLCQLCLLAKCFKPALEFLNTDITSISQEGGQFDAKHFLLYYYYGGMIYAALKNYDRALYFFEVAITTPAMAVSHIMLEAYKKYILVSLILHGKIQNIPKYTSQVVGRFIKPLSQPYHDLATAYSSNNPDELRSVINKCQDTFTRENNMGLAKQVLASLYKKNIQRLTKTFLTLSLSDVASRVQLSGPSDAEKYILNMIEDGEIFATINQKDGMVIFHDDPEKYNSPAMLRRLEEEMAVCTDLDRKMQSMEEDIMVNPQYVKKSCGAPDDDLPPAPSQASPWNTRRMKADLAESKAQNIILEERVKKLHALRKELELVFENEKTSLLKQQARDRETIKALEDRVNTLRKRESEAKEELSQYKQQNESSKFNLEKKIFFLEKENARLEDQLKQVELLLHKKSTGGERRISELEAELKLSMEEVALFKNHVKSLGEKATEVASLKHTLELVELQLNEASQRIKELELELEKGKEARELLDKQQQNLTRLPSLEREVTSLREENRNLRDAVHNKLILEEEVMDLRSRQAGYEEREQQLTQLQATQGQLENLLEQWHRLARDHCVGAPPEKAISGPELLRIRIETLQQKELILTADKGQLDSQLKAAQNGKSRIEMELEKATKQIEKLQGVQEQQSNLIKRLQKKLLLVSRERDSYRSQLDLYEKELTVTSTSALLTSQQQQQKSRIEALEKTVEGYRELAEKLESDLEKASKGSGGLQITERIMKLEEERNMLQKEKEELLKRRDELEIELEQRALKGDFNPLKTRVLHFRMNPAAKAEAEQQDEVAQLKQECERLQERVRVLEGGQTLDVTEAVNFRLATSSSQEVKELREQIKSYDTKLQRLKEAFKSTSQEYREVCYILLGYRIDRIKPNLYRLSSMYADSPDDFLMFKLVNGSPELLETPYSLTLEEFINLHLKHQHSMPVFLSAITLDLFQRQTVCSSGDPITLE